MMKSRKWNEPRRQRAHAPRPPTVSRAAMTVTRTRNPLAASVRAQVQPWPAPVLAEEGFLMRSSMCKLFRTWAKVKAGCVQYLAVVPYKVVLTFEFAD